MFCNTLIPYFPNKNYLSTTLRDKFFTRKYNSFLKICANLNLIIPNFNYILVFLFLKKALALGISPSLSTIY